MPVRARVRTTITVDIPEGLEIHIAMDRPSYRYNAPATLTVTLINGGSQPITLDKRLFDSPAHMSEYLGIDMVMPNGDRRYGMKLCMGRNEQAAYPWWM